MPAVLRYLVRFGSLADLFSKSSLMFAFPESGRSDQQKLGEIRVRFRPEAAVIASYDTAILPNRNAKSHGRNSVVCHSSV